MKRPFCQVTSRDTQKLRREVSTYLRVALYRALREMDGRATLDLIDQRRREMFHEIMNTPGRSVMVAKMLGYDTRPGLFRQPGMIPPMWRPSDETE